MLGNVRGEGAFRPPSRARVNKQSTENGRCVFLAMLDARWGRVIFCPSLHFRAPVLSNKPVVFENIRHTSVNNQHFMLGIDLCVQPFSQVSSYDDGTSIKNAS